MKKVLGIDKVNIHIDTLNVVEEKGGMGLPDMFHVTATCSKKSNSDHKVIAVLCSSQFKDISELVKASLEVYAENIENEGCSGRQNEGELREQVENIPDSEDACNRKD